MNVLFNLIDSCSNPLTGSQVFMNYYTSGSNMMNYFRGPIPVGYTDSVNGSLLVNNVQAGIYKVSFSPAGAANGNTPFNNFDYTKFAINVPSGTGTILACNITSSLPQT